MVKKPPADAGGIRDMYSIPGLGRSPGGGHGNELQYSCLENSMDRGADWSDVAHAHAYKGIVQFIVHWGWSLHSGWGNAGDFPNGVALGIIILLHFSDSSPIPVEFGPMYWASQVAQW